MPPLCSTVRILRVQSRMRTEAPRMSDSSDVSCRLGRKRRRVLLLAWLTLLPLSTPLPVIWQRRDIFGAPWSDREARLIADRSQGVKAVTSRPREAAAIQTPPPLAGEGVGPARRNQHNASMRACYGTQSKKVLA